MDLLTECRLQLEYLNGKFGETGTTNSLLARLKIIDSRDAIALITDRGDPSVGIMEKSWEIECPFYSDADKEEVEHFRTKIKELYSEYSEGRIVVEFNFELKYQDDL